VGDAFRANNGLAASPTPAAIRRSPVHSGQVVGTAQLTPRMRRVVVRSDAMRGVEIRPAQDVELHLRDDTGRRVKRRYTIRSARPDRGELDLDVLLHGAGPGAAWGATARPGDEVNFQGPRGKLVLTDASWHLLCGDESALPAIAAVCEALPRPSIAVIECADESDELPVPGRVHWVHRGDRPPGTPDDLLNALAEIELPTGTGHGYLMGETRSMVALRAALEARGVDHDAIFVKGYWNVARPDRIAGRTPYEAGSRS
jgi:NADPH-dependent ferric siderophore reductase